MKKIKRAVTVKKVLESGIDPITTLYVPIYDCYTRNVIGAIARTSINSFDQGVFSEKDYSFVYENMPIGEELCAYAVRSAEKIIDKLVAQNSPIKWVSVYCPINYLMSGKLYDFLEKQIKYAHFKNAKSLVLHFGQEILFQSAADLKKVLTGIKSLGIKTLLYGFATRQTPVCAINDIPFDYVLLDKEISALMSKKETSSAMEYFIKYLGALNVGTIATNVDDSELIRLMLNAGCTGYVPCETGKKAESQNLSAEQMLSMAEADDERW